MDRELSSEFKNKKKVKRYFLFSAALLIAALAFVGFRSILKPKISRNNFQTSVAAIRTIEATITASGTVIPEYEEAITSPIDAKVQKVLHGAGESIKVGEPILLLDKEFTLLSFDKLNDELKIKKNKIHQLKLNQEKAQIDLEVQYNIKKLQLKSLETALEEETKLMKIGGTSGESLEKVELEVKIGSFELEQIKNQIQNQRKIIAADLTAQGFEISIQEKSIKELQKKMEQAEVKAGRDGVITYVRDDIGTPVKSGDILAQMADMSSFKVEGKISDEHVDNLRSGGQVIVKVNDTELRGTISNIKPEVEKGIIKFNIVLNKKNHKLLRSNMQVDVFIISSFIDKAVSLKNGPSFNGSVQQKVFVIKGDKAVAKTVKVGASNFDYVEIQDGINKGEEVIVSDMTDYMGYDELVIN